MGSSRVSASSANAAPNAASPVANNVSINNLYSALVSGFILIVNNYRGVPNPVIIMMVIAILVTI